MMKNKTNIKHTRRSTGESGVAIILTLGFLAVILGLVLTFADLTIINKKISENYKDVQIARMAAKTAYQRALAAIDAFRGNPSKDMMKIYTYNSNEETRSDEYLEDLIETSVNGIKYYSDYNENKGPHWQYLPVNHSSDTPITSRFLYAVIVDIGKIDPTSAVDSGANAQYHSVNAVSETDAFYTGTAPDGTYIIGRPGRNLSEIFLTSLPGWFTDAYAEDISAANAVPEGSLTVSSRWNSYTSIFDSLGISDEEIKDSFRNVFVINNLPDAEAFWIDNGDLQRNNDELYHRFNLAREDWNRIEVDSILSSPIQFSENTQEDSIFSIHWLNNWENRGHYSDAETRGKQIAANLIDYCDTNSESTADDINNPSFTGLEKVPYINEVKLVFKGWIEDNGSVATSYLKISSADIELVNPYSNPFSDIEAEITVSGSYRMFPPSGARTVEFNDKKINIVFSCAADTYKTQSSTDIMLADSEYSGVGGSPQIDSFLINKLKVKLAEHGDQTVLYDYANLISSAPTADLELSAAGDTGTACLDYQTADPRQNLLEEDWNSDAVFCLETDFLADSDTLDTNNINYVPANGSDAELNSDPWNISTAFIRNAPMKSPWELGLIHRGAPWQTINLKKYRNVNLIGTGGGNSYDGGDANILDQIKMSPDNSIYGKINLNTNLEEALNVLFEKICAGSDISSSNGPGDIAGTTEVNSAKAAQIANTILNINGVNNGSIFYTRSQILRDEDGDSELWDDSLGLGQTKDAAQEEIIGKFINLTKAALPDFYSIIIITQTIKDVGNRGSYEAETDEILATQKVFTTIQWDEEEQGFRIVKYEYLID
ncbi:MAG: hypothetical protein K9L78_03320 [Victivallales bacterium]|nr:hypothetical protein [Victivallales bacterium]